jgi:hypothetical protein
MSTTVKYQIFVSSTYEDLKPFREQVVRAVLEMGHIPVGMEMFSAADVTQWQLIQRQIEASDYYVVLVAHRYGSMDGAVSYTEKEYDYAVSLGVPALGFILQDGASWPPTLVDKEPAKVAALLAFKEKIKKRVISFWTTVEELHGKVSIALMKQFAATPREGWVKASALASPQITTELARLSQENGELRELLRRAQVKEASDHDAAITKTIETLRVNKINVSIWYEGDSDWTNEGKKTLYAVFFLLAPEMMVEQSIEDAAHYVAVMYRSSAHKKKLRSAWPVPSNSLKLWLGDLAALNVIEPSKRKHQVSDKTEYWTLTELGRQIHTAIRKSRLESGLPSSDAPPSDDESTDKSGARGNDGTPAS